VRISSHNIKLERDTRIFQFLGVLPSLIAEGITSGDRDVSWREIFELSGQQWRTINFASPVAWVVKVPEIVHDFGGKNRCVMVQCIRRIRLAERGREYAGVAHYGDAKDFCGNTLLSLRVTESTSNHRGEISSRAVTGSIDEIWITSNLFDIIKYLDVSCFGRVPSYPKGCAICVFYRHWVRKFGSMTISHIGYD